MSMLQFNETYYLNNNPDVLQAVLSGDFPSGLAHYNQYGWSEGRDPNPYFDTSYYLQNNGDVLQAIIGGDFSSPLQHFLMFGASEGRAPSAELAPLVAAFDEAAYRAANPDVDAAIDAGDFQSAMQHWLLYGQFENRPGVPFVGQDFTLTTGTDNYTGGEGNDTFNAPLDLAIDGLVGAQTLQGPDMLNGGGGVNTLNAELNGTGTTANPTINNIQIYNLTSFAGLLGFGNGELDLDRASGYEQLWNRNSRVDLDLYNVGEVAVLGLDNVRDGSEYYVEYDGIEVETQTVVAMRTGRENQADVRLDIRGVDGLIGTLDLIVSDGVYLELQNDADDIENLIISGSGDLRLSGQDDFPFLNTLNATGYNEGLELDVRGSTDLESVLTGDGDDRIIVNRLAVDGNLAVDMGEGMNTLAIAKTDAPFANTIVGSNLTALDFTGGIQNVQTLEFVQNVALGGGIDGTLDLDGFDEELGTISFVNVSANGLDLTILNAPVDLLITASDEFEMGGGLFTIEGTVNLTVESTGPEGADSDVRLNGGVNSETLETLSIVAADDAALSLFGGTDALTTVNVTAQGDDATVNMNLNAPGRDLDALTTVNVTAADDAFLTMTGRAGDPGQPNINSAYNFAFASSAAGSNTTYTINFSTGLSLIIPVGAGNTLAHANAIIDAIEAAFPGVSGNTFTGLYGLDLYRRIEIESDPSFVPLPEIVSVVSTTNAGAARVLRHDTNDGGLPASLQAELVDVAGQPFEPIEFGEGFEALETVTVTAVDGATVNLDDVYGAFTLDVQADGDATVNLTNTGVTTATIAAGQTAVFDPPLLPGDPAVLNVAASDTALVNIGGNTIGAGDLQTLTVSGAIGVVNLNAGDFGSFTTLDVSDVSARLTVNTSAAEFDVAPGQFIVYQIGATTDGDATTTDVAFTGNEVREVYQFVGGDIGEVVITAFTSGADPMTGDRLDLSQLGVNSSGELIFTDTVGGDLVITSLGNQDFTGSITLVGLAGDGADVSSFNIIYA